METFGLYLKSPCDYPDFEAYVKAETPEEALEKIRKEYGNELRELTDEQLLDNIGILKDVPEGLVDN